MAPKLEYAFTLTAFVSKEDTLALGAVKGGPIRYVIPVTHGTLEGSGIKAQLVQGGSDWVLLDPTTGVAHLDIRTQARTADGDLIFIFYPGLLKVDEASGKALQWSPEAKTTQSQDHYWMTTPRFETSSEKLKWMEQCMFVGHGHWNIPGDGTQAAEYEIYKVVSA
jgi:Protein of unknown function (DUF3237)